MACLLVLPLESAAATPYAQLRSFSLQNNLELDCQELLLAAHALSKGAALVSDKVFFGHIPELRRQNWLI